MTTSTRQPKTSDTSAIRTRVRAIGLPLIRAIQMIDPRVQWRNPVMFVVWCGSVLTTAIAIAEPLVGGAAPSGGEPLPGGFTWVVAITFWLTVLAANLAEALAEDQGRYHAAKLRSTQETTTAHRVRHYDAIHDAAAQLARIHDVTSLELKRDDIVVVQADDIIPADGEVIWGIASVNESAITGESAPVIREAGGDRSAVTGGTRVLSDRIVVRVTRPHGKTAVDKMIRLASGAHRHKAPNEIALNALLASFTISFVLVAVTTNAIAGPFAPPLSVPVLAAVVICLIPAEIAALLSVTGVASMSQLLAKNVLADTSHAVECAGDVTIVLFDKTGTITEGDRRATRFITLAGVTAVKLALTAAQASVDDPTPEGVSTLALAAKQAPAPDRLGTFIPFSAQTRLSGRDFPDGTSVRKGAESAVLDWLEHVGTQQPKSIVDELKEASRTIALAGGTPLAIAIKPANRPGQVLGIVELTDVIKPGIPARIAQLRSLGVRTVMITGDNPLTAEAIARKTGVDEFVGDATPEDKLTFVRREQAAGHFVAMSGEGINDAPALAQADVGVALNSATADVKEAANMIVLDDDPTKMVEIVGIGRRQMATRGALTTFNITNDIVRYIALYPALFVAAFPGLEQLDILQLHTPASAILSTVIYSVAVIFVLIRLALYGVPYKLSNLARALNRNLLYYGLGGIVFAAICIKGIDLIVSLFPGY